MAPLKQNIIALVYDFDGTLSPNNMQEDTIFRSYGIDKEEFWKKSSILVEKHGYEKTLAYLKLLIQEDVFKEKPFQREDLKSLAKEIEYYEGVPTYFDRIDGFLKTIPEVKERGITVEHYIVSSGLMEILEGTSIFPYFKKAYACEYDYEGGKPTFPKLVINDTNKTQFLFRINKGKLDLKDDINSHMPEEERRIPFSNMVYIGDGITDVPSMTVIQKSGGHAVAVYNPSSEIVPPEVMKMVEEKRVNHFAPAKFTDDSLLLKIIRQTLLKIVHSINYRSSAEMSLEWVKNKQESLRT